MNCNKSSQFLACQIVQLFRGIFFEPLFWKKVCLTSTYLPCICILFINKSGLRELLTVAVFSDLDCSASHAYYIMSGRSVLHCN